MNRLSLFLAPLALVAVASCDVAPNADGKVYDVGMTTSALHDSFTTLNQPDIATAISPTRVFNVWTAQTATGTQIVGQMFDLNGAPIGPSRIYTNTAHPKYDPKVSYGALGRFLIVYDDEYSSTDEDILGIIVDNTGALVSTPQIDFTTNVDILPQVTYVSTGINQWVVTYQRNGSPNSIQAAYFDSAGTRGTSATIATSTQSISQPQVQYSVSTQRLMFAWTGTTNSSFRFASTALALGPISSLPLIANHDNLWPSIAYQPNTESMGIAFFDELPFDESTTRQRLFILPRGCESISCARAEQNTGIASISPIVASNRPQLTALGSSFIIQNPVFGSFTNGETIRITALDGNNGVLTSFTNQSIPTCSVNLQSDLGSSFGSISTANTTNADRVVMIWDSFCATASKVRGQYVNTSLTRTNYNVSD